jgi:curved DNA-binding protein CbpA
LIQCTVFYFSTDNPDLIGSTRSTTFSGASMAKSLYDILEVSTSASEDAIRAAYERLTAKFDPQRAENAGDAQARIQFEAVKEAFFTLGDAERRQRYDRNHVRHVEPVVTHMEVVEPFWTLPKVIVLAAVLLIGGGWYYKHKEAEAKLGTERAIAEAKVREAEAKAKAEAEATAQARLEAQRERERQRQEMRTRNELESARRNFEQERRRQETTERYAQERQAREQHSKSQRQEYERQRAEAAAVAEAQRRAAREREELCRMERQRYGHAVSC